MFNDTILRQKLSRYFKTHWLRTGLPNPKFHFSIFLFRYFELYPYYVKASTKVETEYYIWDLSSVMTALGGNLGLLLGYSILTMIMSLGGALRVAWKKSRKVLGRRKNEN